MISHQQIDERSLALHQAVANKLRANPALIGIALDNLGRWLVSCSERVRPSLLAWERLLRGRDLREILNVLEDPGEAGQRMRQNSPFCGILSQAERNAIIRAYE